MSSWKKVRLGDYIHEYSKRNKDNANIPVYSVTNINGFCTEYFSKEVASKDKTTYKIVKKGFFAYNPSRINVGSVDWLRDMDRVIVSPLYNVFFVESALDQQYLYYYLKSPVGLFYIKELASGSVRDNLKFSILSDFIIPFPDLTIQKDIAATLDRIVQTINICNTILDKIDLLAKSRFVEMFGDTEINSNDYPVYKLNDLCTVSSSKRIYQEEQSSSGVPFLRISNLVELIDNNRVENELFIPEEKYVELCNNDLVPKADDILITSRGTLGKCYIIQEKDKFYFQDGMISWLYNLDKCIIPLYISLLFDTRDIKRQIENLQSGSTVAYLSIAMLKKLNIVVPPLDLQKQFAAFVAQIDKSKLAVKQILEKAETLKKSLMQEYFG